MVRITFLSIAFLVFATGLSAQQKYEEEQVKTEIKGILSDYEKTINAFINLSDNDPERKRLSVTLKKNFESTVVWAYNDLDSTSKDTAVLKMYEYIQAIPSFLPKGSEIKLELAKSKIENVTPNPSRNGFTVEAHVQKWIHTKVITKRMIADTTSVDSASSDSIAVFDTTMQKRSERLTFHFKLDFFGYTYKGVKVAAISKYKTPPRYMRLTPDEEWWVNLDPEWQKIFRDNAQLSQFPDNMDFQKIAFIRKIDFKDKDITDLSPLSRVTQLKTLDLTNSKITSLEGLENNKTLLELKISGSQIRDLSPISELTSLQLLHCAKLDLTDLKPLAKLTNMIDLDCAENLLMDIDPLKNMALLEFLNISLNLEIDNIEALRGKQNLTKLWMRKMKVTDISAISTCSKMVELDLYNNKIETLVPIRSLYKIMDLNVAHTGISSLASISGLTNITHLNCAGNAIESIEPVKNFYALRHLDVSQTSVADLSPIYKMEYLQRIDIYNTKISVEEKDRFKKRHPKCKILYY